MKLPALERSYARRQIGCQALQAQYGIGPLTAVAILAELGDCRGFSSSREAVRYSGLDITVYHSDQRRAPGHLSRQGPPALCWARYEAAQHASRPASPDYAYYRKAAQRLGHNRACLAIARKLLNAATTHSKTSATRRSCPHDCSRVRAEPSVSRCTAAGSRRSLPPRSRGRPPKTERPHRFPQRETPSPSCRPRR